MKDVQMRKILLENMNKSRNCVRWDIAVSLQFEIKKKVTVGYSGVGQRQPNRTASKNTLPLLECAENQCLTSL